ncbi:MAG: Branched-chain amino acid transporter permease [Acidimicrobiales bacterium]|nr:Branched-chain amino acid transporter permease [Acidimicrobiales bacterium]
MFLLTVFGIALQTALGFQGASYALAATGLNVHFGYTGLSNFGHVGFMLVGAYGVAIAANQGWPLWVGVLLGVGSAVALGLVMGLPTLRLRGDYLAICTIAVAEILRLVANARKSEGLTGSSRGLAIPSSMFQDHNPISRGSYGIGSSFVFSNRQLWGMAWTWGLVALCCLLIWSLMRSPWGRVLRAIREDEDAARALGKNVVAYKLQAFVLGGVIGALAGVMYALDASSVNPSTWIATLTFALYVVVILGGPGTVAGPVVGAVIYWFLFSLTEGILSHLWFQISDTTIGAVRLALVGVGLMALMVFRPQGILGNRKEMLAGGR